ncbi:P-loop NTPase family protein [Ovoidimarina sediminis]|uniref:DnaA ATPase domain-containing protein n=1 Tax=Ovoidimarina sediminis TaxID=3079856 RepID=UPI00290FAA7F|nr:DnaA/Hda family protein [Rhodophyticola sp. MJ-SS7]MDU8945356.1 DnaA/Hda family protein [Rhodophyticola sp. MJ-SS7]
MTHRQLTFDLPVREARGLADFFVSPANETALAAIEGWEDWPFGKLVLTGPQGAGKTHLAHVWATLSGAEVLPAFDLRESDVPALSDARAIALEDMDRGPLDERAIFHLHNMLAERGRALLMTARVPPRDWNLQLPDLFSRVSAATVVSVSAPDDALLQAVLIKQFTDRQLSVSPDLIGWLLRRIDRSFDAARRAVETLDAAALAEGRPVTRAFAARLLDNLTEDRA